MNPDLANRPAALADQSHLPDATAEALSAWMDGDPAFAHVGDALGSLPDADIDNWHSYHLIGDVLRAGAPAGFLCSDLSRSSARAQAFARGIVEQASAVHLTTASPVAAVLTPVAKPVSIPVVLRGPAANDGVFRWKMVAGLASVAAVAAVAWTVIGGSGLLPSDGAVLATAPANQQQVGSTVADSRFLVAAPEPVWVSTPQGVVLRDPRMEELMHTHRQSGGGPALQVPAGFLRAATHDAVQR